MNPWQSLRREIDGAVRSLRYDLSVNQAKRAMRRDTVYLPLVTRRPSRDRRRFYAVAAAVLLPVAGVSGYLAVTSGFDALFPGEGAPNGLPGTNLDPNLDPNRDPNPPAPSPQGPGLAQPVSIDQPQRRRPAPRTSPVLRTPLPTPLPSCLCTSTPPPPTPAPTPAPTESPSPSPGNSASPWPTISTPPSGSPSPRPTWRPTP